MGSQPAPQLVNTQSSKSIEPSIDTQKLIEFSKINNLNMHESNQRQPKSRQQSRNLVIDRTGDENTTT